MMQHVLDAISILLETNEPSISVQQPSSGTLTEVIISALAVVIAAGLTALASLPRRADREARANSDNGELVAQAYRDVTADRDRLAGQLAASRRAFERLNTKHARLREACVEHDLDPDEITGGD